ESSGDGGDMFWENSYGESNSGSLNIYSSILNLATIETVSIKRVDGQQFQFDSIYITNSGGTNVAVGCYRNGGSVADTQYPPANTTSGHAHSFGGITVDEVRITASNFINVNFDSF